MLPVLRVDSSVVLPDNKQWRFRFEIKSETSDRVYVVAQNIAKNTGAVLVLLGLQEETVNI